VSLHCPIAGRIYRVKLDFIRPGNTHENNHIESFNSRLRDEMPKRHQFVSMGDADRRLKPGDRTTLQPRSAPQFAAESDPERIRAARSANSDRQKEQNLALNYLKTGPTSLFTALPVSRVKIVPEFPLWIVTKPLG